MEVCSLGAVEPPHFARLAALAADLPTVVFAAVSGAHLYGFESPDSDVDLRGAFVHPLRARLGLRRPRETFDRTSFDDGLELDLVAHDVRKWLRLAVGGSGEVLEQISSPLIVITSPWYDELRALAAKCATKLLHHHYRGFFGSRRGLLLREGATVKHLLYAYRAVLSGIHVLRTGVVEANLPTLLAAGVAEGLRVVELHELIARKRSGAEKGALAPGEAAQHLTALDELALQLDSAHIASHLPERVPTTAPFDDFLVRVHEAQREQRTSDERAPR